MLKRRDFTKSSLLTGCSLSITQSFAIPATLHGKADKLKFGIISDLHHLQFGKSEEPRLKSFMDEVLKQHPDFIIQCGDFCRPQQSDGIMREWNRFKGDKYHVLGNHDMDVCDKATIMKLWDMQQRYYSFDKQGFHFVVMDRNFLRQEDKTLIDYNGSNWGPFAAPYRSFTDAEQLKWLRDDLSKNNKPVIVFMHQPVFLSDYFDELGNANEILDIFDETNLNASMYNRGGKIAAVFMGHDHDDRYAVRNGVHYFIINSASYVYNEGPHFFKDSLFAFITLKGTGELIIEGRKTSYRDEVPKELLMKFPTSISNRNVSLINRV